MPCSVDIQKAKEQHGAMVGSRQFRIAVKYIREPPAEMIQTGVFAI